MRKKFKGFTNLFTTAEVAAVQCDQMARLLP